VSLSDLFTWSAAQRDDYARSIRARIQELYSTLGVRFPIYVLVTKTDLLAGFSEFFGDLGREARAQVWGTTFDFPSARRAGWARRSPASSTRSSRA
jgi:type VI secretion system protein ImpL